VEIEHIDSVRVYLDAEKIPEQDVLQCHEWLAETFGKILIDHQRFEKSIRLYLALKNILKTESYRIAAIKCQEEMINCYSCFCLANSLLNDDGFTVACETDINAALTMRVLSTLSEGLTLFGDVNHLDLQKNMLRIVNCGSMPTLMAESREEVDFATQYEYMGQSRGATTVLSIKDSPVTLARLSRIKGKLVMLAAQGQAQKFPKERFKEAREFWPQAMIQLDCNARNLVHHIRSNHMHVCFGHHLDALREFCTLKNIDCICPE
jgi:L-fucose isomerase